MKGRQKKKKKRGTRHETPLPTGGRHPKRKKGDEEEEKNQKVIFQLTLYLYSDVLFFLPVIGEMAKERRKIKIKKT